MPLTSDKKEYLMFGAHVPSSTSHPMGGVQHEFQFANGYGASVVRHQYSYGSSRGLWELGVLGLDGRLCYDTPVTSDVLGYLSESGVTEALDQINALPAPAEVA